VTRDGAPLLETRRLTKAFGGLMAVLNVDFTVARGGVRAIIGPNGAGKTTFFNMIAGQLIPTGGQILFKGQDITTLAVHQRSRLGIGRSYQITNVFPDLSTFENLRVAVQSRLVHYALWRDAEELGESHRKAEELLRATDLCAKRDAMAANLSHGEQRYLEIGIALATEPELLLLDEPTAGMSADERTRTARLIKTIAAGTTIILVEHDMDVVMEISDRITVLHYGQILAEGPPAAIRANAEVQRVYLRDEP
jgi:branched-chain amino acid transport system ATP-binding protein